MICRLICATALAFGAYTQAQQATDPVPIARKALDLLLAGSYRELRQMFNEQMLQAASEDALRNQIGPVIQNLGKPQNIGEPRVQNVQGMSVVVFPVHFASSDLDVVLSVDQAGKLAGLRFAPGKHAQAQAEWTPPPYVTASAFRSRDVTIGENQWKLPGTLSMPNGSGPFPAVVLVQGSGPEDRDESVGANKPFRDIAEGLASHGIAVLPIR